MTLAYLHVDKQHILYDSQQIKQPIEPCWFQAGFWQSKQQVTGIIHGRSQSLFIRPSQQAMDSKKNWILRPYYRGGLIAKFNQCHYLWIGLSRNRAFREFRLLTDLRAAKLAVPIPIAAYVVRRGLSYQAAIITQVIPQSQPLTQYLNPINRPVLQQVGRLIYQAHQLGLDHVDLNANNILIDNDQKAWLIDLDRCRLRCKGHWQKNNLARLARSLEKLAPNQATSAFAQINSAYNNS